MAFMFYYDTAFNGNVANWNTNSVTNMAFMFYYDTSFNGNVANWNTNSVTDMSYMFFGDSAFNQNIGSWNTVSVTSMAYMFSGVTLSDANYDALLNGWSGRTQTSSVTFDGGNSKYTTSCSGSLPNGQAGRLVLTGTYGWTITDGGLDTCPYIAPTSPSLTLSNTLIDQGQSILFTSSFTAGSATSYTYNLNIVNSVTPSIIIANFLTTNSYAGNTFFWTPPPNLYTANTFEANLIISDGTTMGQGIAEMLASRGL